MDSVFNNKSFKIIHVYKKIINFIKKLSNLPNRFMNGTVLR